MSSIKLVVGDLTNTGRESGSFICTWKLRNFSKLDCARKKSYRSPLIRSSAKIGNRWYLKIYPGGNAPDSEGFISLYLCSCIDQREKLKVKYVIDLRNTGEKIVKSEVTGYVNFSLNWGYDKLIERTLLLPELIDDVLIIQVKADYTQTFVTDVDGVTEAYPEMDSELICNDISRLNVEKTGADVVISVGKEDIPAHYAVIAARSKVFAAMFKHDTIEKSTRRVSIDDFDADSVKAVLQFMYSGSLRNLTIDLAQDLLRAADKYDMDSLKTYCSNYLIPRLDMETVVNITTAADMHNADKLIQSAFQYICDHRSEFDFEKHASAFTGPCKTILNTIKGFLEDRDPNEKIEIYFV